MKFLSSLATFAALLLCAIAPPNASAKYCQRVQYFTAGEFTRCVSAGCEYIGYDFKKHAVGSCISGSCMDGQGVGYVAKGVYVGRFRYGYPEGDGVMHLGYVTAKGGFVDTLVLTGTFRDGCMVSDATAVVPSSALFWQGRYDEESGVSTGKWYLRVTHPGHNVAPVFLGNGGISDQPSKATADAALASVNERESAVTSSGYASKSTSTAAPPTLSEVPSYLPGNPVPSEGIPGPLPFPGDPDRDAASTFLYLQFPDIDRNAPLSPHMETLFRPVYKRALELYDAPSPAISKSAARSIAILYERGWLVEKNPMMVATLSLYAYQGGSKPTLPLPGAAPSASTSATIPAYQRSPPITESTTQALFIDSGDYNANEDAYFYMTSTTLPTDQPLPAQTAALLRPVFDNLVHIYTAREDINVSARAGYVLSLFYERGWIVPRDPELVKTLRQYSSFREYRPSLNGLPPPASSVVTTH